MYIYAFIIIYVYKTKSHKKVCKSYFLKQLILLKYLSVLLSKCCKTYINKNLIMHDSIHF